MSEVLQTNVFFFITSLAVVAFTILVCIVLYQVIRILGSVRAIVDRLEEGSEIVAENIQNLKNYFTETSFLKSIIGSVFGLHSYEKKRTRKPRKKVEQEESIDKDKETT